MDTNIMIIVVSTSVCIAIVIIAIVIAVLCYKSKTASNPKLKPGEDCRCKRDGPSGKLTEREHLNIYPRCERSLTCYIEIHQSPEDGEDYLQPVITHIDSNSPTFRLQPDVISISASCCQLEEDCNCVQSNHDYHQLEVAAITAFGSSHNQSRLNDADQQEIATNRSNKRSQHTYMSIENSQSFNKVQQGSGYDVSQDDTVDRHSWIRKTFFIKR